MNREQRTKSDETMDNEQGAKSDEQISLGGILLQA
jgi:hypothetical protein